MLHARSGADTWSPNTTVVQKPNPAWLFLGLSFGCGALFSPFGAQPPEQAARAEHAEPKYVPIHVVVVALDGVRARDVFDGSDVSRTREFAAPEEVAPNLNEMAALGLAMGRPGSEDTFEVSGPNFVSLPGYTELFTGAASRCQDNDCRERPSTTMLETFLDAGLDSSSVAIFSSWEAIEHALSERAATEAFTSFGRSGGTALRRPWLAPDLASRLEDQVDEDGRPGHGDYRPDSRTAALALEYLRRYRPAFSFLGLGDTDEYAHADDYEGYLRSLSAADEVIGELRQLAQAWTLRGEPTTLIVTTDHGRSEGFTDHGDEHPESKDTWLIAEGAGLRSVVGARRLADVAPRLQEMIASD